MPTKQFRLITLGRLALLTPEGREEESLGKRRRKLAILAVLALAGRPLERDYLTSLFWGETDEERARHSLSDALSHLRRVLGRDAVPTRSSEVELGDGVALEVDAAEFARICRTDPLAAVRLYRGPFLECVHVPASPAFEHWVSRERDRLERLFVHAAAEACRMLRSEDRADECAQVAERWLAADMLSTGAAVALLGAYDAAGTRDAAAHGLSVYQRLCADLERDYGTAPEPPVAAAARRLAERVKTMPVPAVSAPQPDAAPAAALPPAAAVVPATPHGSRIRFAWSTGALAFGALVLGALGVGAAGFGIPRLGRAPSAAAFPARPALAVMDIRGDSARSDAAWVATGMPRMIATDLLRSGAVDVIGPERLRDVTLRAKARGGTTGSLPLPTLLDIAKRAGATWVATGALTGGGRQLLLNLSVYETRTGKLVQLITASGADALKLADQASARLLDAASAGSPGPRLADLETGSLAAYQHFIRAAQAGDEGRYRDQLREADAALALDSGFISALRMRLDLARRASDEETQRRLLAVFHRNADRLTEWDRLSVGVDEAMRNGERDRSELLAQQLVRRYPRDPRAYSILADVYGSHGEWDTAEDVLTRELALDSLAAAAGTGPCVPCTAYRGLTSARIMRGDLVGAIQSAQQWVALQGDLPAAWTNLSEALTYAQRYDEAIRAARIAAAYSAGEPEYEIRIGRVLLAARRFAAVDSALLVWKRSGVLELMSGAYDVQSLLQRERGDYAASNAAIDSAIAVDPNAGALRLVRGDNLGRLGRYAAARRLFEGLAHGHSEDEPYPQALTGDRARAFCWEHALEASAIAPSGDTLLLHALADSIAEISARSYYGRDWHLAYHVRGLIALQGGRYEAAAAQLDSARWSTAGWNKTDALLGRTYLALGRPRDALRVIRNAYAAPLDAMGRYQPRRELDSLMSVSFEALGWADSARTYQDYRLEAVAAPAPRGTLATVSGSR